jgi:hypothetical protein
MTRSFLIGLCGHAGCGKDTFADILVKEYRFFKLGLADPLKRICKEVYNFSDEQLWGPSAERNKPDSRYKATCSECKGLKSYYTEYSYMPYDCEVCEQKGYVYLTPRKALQALGTEWGRAMYEDTWIDYAIKASDKILKEGCLYSSSKGVVEVPWREKEPAGVVIPDVRFLNEITKVKDAGGFVIRLKRKGVVGKEALDAGIQNHASEIEQDTVSDSIFSGVIEVAEGLDKFKEQVFDVMESLMLKGEINAVQESPL